MKKNPFKPTFGSIPVALAGREHLIGDVLEGLNNAPGDPNRATIFVGARGTGKTVMLAAIAEQAEACGWISANVTSGEGMLDEILVQIREKASHILKPETVTRLAGIQVGGLGITVESDKRRSTWRAEVTALIKELNREGSGLLITVDEISQKHKELKLLADTVQHFFRERLDAALLLAGLPSNVSMLLRDDNISFLRRAFQHSLSSIGINDVAYAMRKTIEDGGRSIAEDALRIASEGSGGYAFLIQLIGYHVWKQHEDDAQISAQDAKEGITFAARDMDRMIFDAVMNELSVREREYLIAMTKDKDISAVSDIASRMDIDSNNASQIRRRLIEHGLIGERGRGLVAYELPFLREYLLRRL